MKRTTAPPKAIPSNSLRTWSTLLGVLIWGGLLVAILEPYGMVIMLSGRGGPRDSGMWFFLIAACVPGFFLINALWNRWERRSSS